MKKVLLVGESWMVHMTHVKGYDSFTTSRYETGEKWIKQAFELAGYEVMYMPSHIAANEFPYTMEELSQYDSIVLSDIGANTLLLPDSVFYGGEKRPNRCELIRDYVLQGGGLLMVGGYLTFSGIDAKGKWGMSAVQEVLPVKVLDIDDRCEHPEGIAPITISDHEIMQGIPAEWPEVLGYNRTIPVEGTTVIATVGKDPFIAVSAKGKGRSAVFTTDCAPHWAPVRFLEWEGYDRIWKNLMDWLTKGRG